MGRDQIKSASRHSFHDAHTAPAAEGAFENLVRSMLVQLGEDPAREGLRNTPARVAASLRWLTRGYGMAVEDVIGDAVFEEKHDNMILVRDIEIYSLCEHHMLPFFGRAHVAYLPNGRIVGLSKIPRVVEVFARRLQVQERLTDQVADALMRSARAARRGRGDRGLSPLHDDARRGEAELQDGHLARCAARFRDDGKTRDEFLRLVHGGGDGCRDAPRRARWRAGSRSSPAPRAASGSPWRTSCAPPARTWCASRAPWRTAPPTARPTLHCDVTAPTDVERVVATVVPPSSASPISS